MYSPCSTHLLIETGVIECCPHPWERPRTIDNIEVPKLEVYYPLVEVACHQSSVKHACASMEILYADVVDSQVSTNIPSSIEGVGL
jgi:hypothetical protein